MIAYVMSGSTTLKEDLNFKDERKINLEDGKFYMLRKSFNCIEPKSMIFGSLGRKGNFLI